MCRLPVPAVVLLVLSGVGCADWVGGLEFDPGSDPEAAVEERVHGDPVKPPPAQDPDVEGRVSSVGAVSGDLLAGFRVNGRIGVFVLRDATLAIATDGAPRALPPAGVREGDTVRVWGQVRRRGGQSSVDASYVLIDVVE